MATVDLSSVSKFPELILYICSESREDERFSLTKLNKLLFYTDFVFFREFGESVTGQNYQRLEHGPAPRGLVPVMDELQAEGSFAIVPTKYYGRTQKRPTALREPNLKVFSAEEIAIAARMIHHFWNMNATEISEASHEFDGWKLAKDRETIPYGVALIDRNPESGEYQLSEREQAIVDGIDMSGVAELLSI